MQGAAAREPHGGSPASGSAAGCPRGDGAAQVSPPHVFSQTLEDARLLYIFSADLIFSLQSFHFISRYK